MISLKQKFLHFTDSWVDIPVVGFDISDRTIKYLQFVRKPALGSVIFGEIELPEGVIDRGDIIQEEALVSLLKNWLRREGRAFRDSAFAVSLPEEKGFLRLIQVPKVKKDDIAQTVRWEIETNVPLPLDQLIYDYEIADSENKMDHLDVLTVAYPKTVIESYLRVLKGSRLNPLALEHEAQSVTRVVLQENQSTEPMLILDFGQTRTGIMIISGGEIVFTTTIELGGKILEENIERELKVEKSKAIEFKETVGLNKKFADGKLFAALTPAISVLSDELKRAIEYYQTHSHHLHSSNLDIKELFLAGGDSNLLGLDTYLAAILKIPVTRAEVPIIKKLWTDHGHIPYIPKSKLNSYAAAMGLAMKSWE